METTSIVPLRALKDNYIWAIQDLQQKALWVVDPGEARPVIEHCQKTGLSLRGILLTHHHPDHAGGVEGLLGFAGDIPVYASEPSLVPTASKRLKEGDEIIVAGMPLRALTIPGHTLDHLAYYNDRVLFCGDTLFSAGCGRIFEGTPAMMYASLSRLMRLNEDTEIYCGHEYTKANLLFAQRVEPSNTDIARKLQDLPACTLPSTLAEEKRINPFLRCESPTVVQAVEAYAQCRLGTAEDVFRHLREWKNHG